MEPGRAVLTVTSSHWQKGDSESLRLHSMCPQGLTDFYALLPVAMQHPKPASWIGLPDWCKMQIMFCLNWQEMPFELRKHIIISKARERVPPKVSSHLATSLFSSSREEATHVWLIPWTSSSPRSTYIVTKLLPYIQFPIAFYKPTDLGSVTEAICS